jgi:NAD(P)-dependent dehydrogenase (short-subunit alcohol dehydrogenase family)
MNVDLLESDAMLAAEVVEECVGSLGRLDILVNNAGIIRRAPALEFGEDDWESVIRINLSAAFYLSQAAARHCVGEDKGGKIINTASVLSYEGGVIVPSYSASKAGIANLTRPRERVGASEDQRQRHRPELLHHRADERAARGRREVRSPARPPPSWTLR